MCRRVEHEGPESLNKLVYGVEPPPLLLRMAIWALRIVGGLEFVVGLFGLMNTKTANQLGGAGAVFAMIGQAFLFLVLAQLIVTLLELRRLLRELHAKVDDLARKKL
jgi:hypothetical protein